MSVEQWNDEKFEAGINDPMLTVIDFGATWCGPCKKLHPIMAELANEYAGKIRVFYIDVGESTKVAQKYQVFSVPQVMFFKNGERLATINGLQAKGKIAEQINKLL